MNKAVSVSLETRIDQRIENDSILTIEHFMHLGKPTGVIEFAYRDSKYPPRTVTMKIGKNQARWIVDKLLALLDELD
jgi:hypothetical protein